ncbi:alpha/beta hydrolase [Pseudonocardia sp. KRD-184]|uniref:Alpha/beta hydrolase n=1 Tax=Pseudonocardia oceani TaxID=2792013 RepID=A0ABS6U4H1_9PSEU|nr:alpha/beta hydrolase [Pseudonocardia oceani]MBW0088413.1 alpha/beta hydrolase [Pseudonocardia oceani]MBW0096156.1 alpha/beta hydrolase [Pseudonocardia oceani]MBW0110343.1 alpha/beta hydrolase [Pseudonocardia oceani]MBW0121591.1 alpha/beta hydrolase [Pseudonocardia oceani]MBW0127119.1 alpha/beta hydrolase [Pseudonocardia oceani]
MATVHALPTGTELQFRMVHGYRRAFRIAGSGPPLVLVHGIGDSSATWAPVLPALARRHLVIAPDLLGHGSSDKPRADYSVAAYANGVRDLLGVLGVERATLVGHSLGGGVAMQFAYQFPERTERLVLVGSGGAGPDVTPVLRAMTLPGAAAALGLLRLPTARLQVGAGVALLRLLGTDLGQDAPDLLRMVDALPDATARAAFIRTLRAVVDWRGQVVTMLDRCYLTRGMPTMLVWGARDAVVPVAHAHRAHDAMPGSRLEVFPGAGHFPFHTDPVRFVDLLEDFLATTAAARWSPHQWRELLRDPEPGPLHAPDQRNAT